MQTPQLVLAEMGEMSVRSTSRPRKDLAASFNKLKRMAIDLKSARKSLAAHHGLVAEFVSVSFCPPPKDPLPRRDSQPLRDHPHRDIPTLPPADLAPPYRCRTEQKTLSPPSSPPDRSRSAPVQLLNSQETWIDRQSSLPCSLILSKNRRNRALSSLRSFTSKISAALTSSSSPKSSNTAGMSPSPQKKEFQSRKIPTPGVYPGKRLPRSAFWASVFLVFLCFFLYTGKAVAVAFAVCAYFVFWSTSRRMQNHHEDRPVQDGQGSNLCRSSTISTGSRSAHKGTPDHKLPIRTGSSPSFPVCLQGEAPSEEPVHALDPQSSAIVSKESEHFYATVKLGSILMLALCGLAYGQIAAMFLCSCCILLFAVKKALC